jgi:hypothetical protein
MTSTIVAWVVLAILSAWIVWNIFDILRATRRMCRMEARLARVEKDQSVERDTFFFFADQAKAAFHAYKVAESDGRREDMARARSAFLLAKARADREYAGLQR